MSDGARDAIARWSRDGTLAVAGGVLLFLATRYRFPITGVGNPDIAGMLYQADLLRAGGVPYVDAIDMKPPGTFFVIAAIFAVLGRSLAAVKVVYAAWCLLAAPAIWLSARALYERRLAAGFAVLLYLSAIATFDLNYSSWMTTAYAWAFACLVLAIRRGTPWLHLVAGVFASLAFALKGQAIVLGLVFALVWTWGRRRDEPGAAWVAWPLWIAGAALGLAPLALWFARRHALAELAAALLPLGDASAYAARSSLPSGFWLDAWKVPLQQIKAFPLHALLATAAVVGVILSRRGPPETRAREPLAPAALFFVISVAACGLGGLRFYLHYLPQVLPGLTLLAVHPGGLTWWSGPARLFLIGATILLGAGIVGRVQFAQAVNVDYPGDADAMRAGEYVKSRSTPDDRMLVWGWTAWPVYFYAERRSPSVVFKVLGQVTEYNDNGIFSKQTTVGFKPGPIADRLLSDFTNAPPAYFVKTKVFFLGAADQPLDGFAALKAILRNDYVLVRTFGDVEVYERRAARSSRPDWMDRRPQVDGSRAIPFGTRAPAVPAKSRAGAGDA